MTFPMVTFIDSLTYIVPKFYKYTSKKVQDKFVLK